MKRLLVLAAAATAMFAAHAQAPAFPGSKPISLVVPFAAGGPTDRVARDLAEAMRKAMGGSANFVVENVNGAGSEGHHQADGLGAGEGGGGLRVRGKHGRCGGGED